LPLISRSAKDTSTRVVRENGGCQETLGLLELLGYSSDQQTSVSQHGMAAKIVRATGGARSFVFFTTIISTHGELFTGKVNSTGSGEAELASEREETM
jgi:hypothetical protein